MRTSRFGARRDVQAGEIAVDALQRLQALEDAHSARIAHLLHDEVSQVLASAHLALNEAGEDVPMSAQLRLLDVRTRLLEVQEQLRRASHALHPAIVEDLGLPDAVTFTARVFSRRSGIQVDASVVVDPPYPLSLGTLLFRFVQEALANVARHAHATAVSIAIVRDGSDVVATVSDDGTGFDVAAALGASGSDRLGLKLVQARIEAAGGTLDIVCVSGQGTRLRALVPAEG